MTTYPKSPRYENRKLLDLAHRIERCVNCGAAPEYGCIPCHSNAMRHGKGRGLKAHDNEHFAGCTVCHDWFDSRDNGETDPTGIYHSGRQEKNEFFTVMRDRTFRQYWDNGWLNVTA